MLKPLPGIDMHEIIERLETVAGMLRDPGVLAIGHERHRVIYEEGYSPGADASENADGEMVDAAICYLLGHGQDKDRAPYERVPGRWPWDASSFKPGNTGNHDADRLRDLERAGQLIAAEITRLRTSAGQLPLQ